MYWGRLRKGILSGNISHMGEWKHYQTLDYEQLPFKYWVLHDYIHFARDCKKAIREKYLSPNKMSRWKMQRKSGNRRRYTQKGIFLAQCYSLNLCKPLWGASIEWWKNIRGPECSPRVVRGRGYKRWNERRRGDLRVAKGRGKKEAPSLGDQVTNIIPMVEEPLKSKYDESCSFLFQVHAMEFTPSWSTQLVDHCRKIVTRKTSLPPRGNEDSSSHETKSIEKRRCRRSKKEPREKKANLNKKLASQPQILDILKESGFKGGTSEEGGRKSNSITKKLMKVISWNIRGMGDPKMPSI